MTNIEQYEAAEMQRKKMEAAKDLLRTPGLPDGIYPLIPGMCVVLAQGQKATICGEHVYIHREDALMFSTNTPDIDPYEWSADHYMRTYRENCTIWARIKRWLGWR